MPRPELFTAERLYARKSPQAGHEEVVVNYHVGAMSVSPERRKLMLLAYATYIAKLFLRRGGGLDLKEGCHTYSAHVNLPEGSAPLNIELKSFKRMFISACDGFFPDFLPVAACLTIRDKFGVFAGVTMGVLLGEPTH